ncbi:MULTISPECIES: winged helix-turn-helix domain-containing protein [unclassified Streptomyces]|uniref:ArsR/SmtB family transcription factor n=1 Tax=unclassified Streptomyces TaxID=2593676 RepID=UPI002E77E974|nr:winged helix-turn-helix domain-containing protein [Streptomyces sp. JV184]MEE1748323.1 winged helix-turn-helix domain-containing protein [Streptomyces sp. JV184]
MDLGKLGALHIRVLKNPGATVLSLVADALGGRFQGVPAPTRALIQAAAPSNCTALLRPLFNHPYALVPDCLAPPVAASDNSADAYVEQLSDIRPDDLLTELEAEFPQHVPSAWQPVVSQPRAWARSYAHVMRSVWEAIRPTWHRHDTLFEREYERIGASTVNGTLDLALAQLGPRFQLAGNSLRIPDRRPGSYRLDESRPLTLIPVASGIGASMFSHQGDTVEWIAYPLSSLSPAGEREDRTRDKDRDPLALVLGEPRAAVLRALRRPLTMGELSSLLQCSPGTTTHHCSRLEAAGLLNRNRQGQHVRIALTDRGNELVGLLV